MTRLIGYWLGALMAAMLAAHAAQAAQVNIAAVVNDSIITTADVEQRRDIIMATAGIPMTVENQQKITPRVVQSLIDEALELQDAKSQSIIITDEEVSKAVDGMGSKGENNESLRNFIKRNNLSLASVEAQVRAQLAWNKVVLHRGWKICASRRSISVLRRMTRVQQKN
jgi:peptidyl-prolyl cis-trans isomerase SurA